MREHWSRILDGEIRKPGSFSFLTLQMVSLLDHNIAKDIEYICGFIIDGKSIPRFGMFSTGKDFSCIQNLADIGFIHLFRVENAFDFKNQGEFIKINGHTLEVKECLQGKLKFPCLESNADRQRIFLHITADISARSYLKFDRTA